MFVHPSAWYNLAPTGQISSILILSILQKKNVENIQVSLQSDKNNDTLHEDNIHFLPYLAEFFETVRRNQNTHFMFNNFVSNSAVYEVNVGKYCTARQSADDNIMWNIHTVCWTTKATNTHSEYIILTAFPLQEWLHEHTSMLCYTYVACLVNLKCSQYCWC
jgi:hypothetical protein